MEQNIEWVQHRNEEWQKNNRVRTLYGSRDSDVHLLFPCAYEDTFAKQEQSIVEAQRLKTQEEVLNAGEEGEYSQKDACEFFLKKLQEYNNSEMTGDFTRNISRTSLGEETFCISYGDSVLEETGLLYFSRHFMSKVGMIGVIFSKSSIPASLLLTALCGGVLKIRKDGKDVLFSEWMENQKISIQGNPKAVVFEYGEVTEREIRNCLACEYEPMAPIVGQTFVDWSRENFAQYDVAKVYASDSCLFYELSDKEQGLYERLNQQAVEMFFVELLLMQEAAINLVCNKVYFYLNQELNDTNKNANETLFELSKEASNAILFVDYKKLRYPTVRVSAKKIAERFGIEEDMDRYYKCREVLEQMISIDAVENETIDSRLMNLLLLMLTMLQVLPTLSDIAKSFLTGSIDSQTIYSNTIGTLGCIVLYLIYRISYYRARKKSKRHLFGERRGK